MTRRPINHGLRIAALAVGAFITTAGAPQPSGTTGQQGSRDTSVDVREIMDLSQRLERVPFREVILAATGYQVLPFDADSEADSRVLVAIAEASRTLIEEIKNPGHPVHRIPRVNEVSMQLENRLAELVNSNPRFSCNPPMNALGRNQRSGYPDLEIIDLQTGKVFYLDPKLYHRDSRSSAFRTFYYEPKSHTQKVNHDAVHLLMGIAHGGRKSDMWELSSWSIVDLHDFEIGFKAEFQASNRDLYREENTLLACTQGD